MVYDSNSMIELRLNYRYNNIISYRDNSRVVIRVSLDKNGEYVYGIHLSIDYPEAYLEHPESFPPHRFSLSYSDEEKGLVSTAICKTNLSEYFSSSILYFSFIQLRPDITTSNPDGILALDFKIKDAYAINAQGEYLNIRTYNHRIILTDVPVVQDSLTTTENIPALAAFEASLSPNPSTGSVYLQSNQRIQHLRVFDLQGRMRWQVDKPSTNAAFHLPLEAALYFVQFVDYDGQQVVQRLVVK